MIMPPFRKNWLFYTLFIVLFVIILTLSTSKASKGQVGLIVNKVIKQGDSLLIESRRTNDLLTKLLKR